MLTKYILSDCAESVILGLNYLANVDLKRDDVPVTTALGDVGIGDSECEMVERNVNDARRANGKEEIDDGTITPATTIAEVIGYVCD